MYVYVLYVDLWFTFRNFEELLEFQFCLLSLVRCSLYIIESYQAAESLLMLSNARVKIEQFRKHLRFLLKN